MKTCFKLLGATLLALLPVIGSALPNLYNVNSHSYTTYAGNAPAAGYKYTPPSTEEGDAGLVAKLNPTISTDGFTATIVWAPTGSVDIDVIYVKAGNQYAMFNVADVNWTPYDGFTVTQNMLYTLVTTGKGKNAQTKKVYQAISHVSLDGQILRITTPDGGTTALLVGLGLLSAAVIARRRKA